MKTLLYINIICALTLTATTASAETSKPVELDTYSNTKTSAPEKISGTAWSFKEARKNEKGALAPEFNLEDRDGNKVSLAAYEDKLILLDFWASWCRPCLMAVPDLNKFQKKYADKVQVVGISIDRGAWKTVLKTLERHPMNYTVTVAPGELAGRYGMQAIPYLVLIKNGKIKKTLVGYHDLAELENALKPWL